MRFPHRIDVQRLNHGNSSAVGLTRTRLTILEQFLTVRNQSVLSCRGVSGGVARDGQAFFSSTKLSREDLNKCRSLIRTNFLIAINFEH